MGNCSSLLFMPGRRPDRKQYNGLKNQGATCYLNTVLQSLYMTERFRKEVKNFEQDSDQGSGINVSLLQELQNLFQKLDSSVGTTEGITKCLGIRNVNEQQDAVEYYQKIIKAVGPPGSRVFEGKMSNNTQCVHHPEFQEKCPFITIPLSIEVGQNDVYNVEKGLKAFFKTSTLDEDNWLYCEKCDKKTETKTWNRIEEFPPILTLYLKRFEFSYEQMSLVKNNCRMDIPHRLPMSAFIHPIPDQSKNTENSDYDLYAVINHRGGRSGGHYNALIKSFVDDEWYCFDDSSVTKDSVASLHHSRLACLLMYKKNERDNPVYKEKSQV